MDYREEQVSILKLPIVKLPNFSDFAVIVVILLEKKKWRAGGWPAGQAGQLVTGWKC